MLEKNKDYVEFTLQYTSVDWARSKDCPEVCLKGYSDFSFPGVPIMDVVCNEFDHKVVVVSKRDFEKLQKDNQHYRELAKQREENYNLLLTKTGFNTEESLIFYLTIMGKCNTLLDVVASYINERDKALEECEVMKKKLEECEKDYISERDKAEALAKEIDVYSHALKEWKESTGYPSPSAVKTALESGASWCHAYNEIKKANEKLADDVKSWKNVTGYSTPEDYMHARISGAFHTPFDYTAAWQKATGCDTPEAAKCRINNLIGEAEALESDYNRLLALTGFDNEGEIEDFLEQNNDRNKLTTVIDNLKLENETMKTALRASNLAMQKELENNIDEWQKFTDSNWQGITGFSTPEKCSSYIDRLEKKLEDIKNLTEED